MDFSQFRPGQHGTGLKEYYADLYPRYKEEILKLPGEYAGGVPDYRRGVLADQSAMDQAGQSGTILRNREAETRIPKAETRTDEERWRKHKKDRRELLDLERWFMSGKTTPERGARVVENGPNDIDPPNNVNEWSNYRTLEDQNRGFNTYYTPRVRRGNEPTLDIDRLINRFRGNNG
jgi:hypothetical protein